MLISFVIPCYHSTETVGLVVQSIEELAEANNYDTEIILVNDGPKAATFEKIKELQAACQRKLDELYAVCVLKPKYQDMELVSCSYLLEVLVNGLSHTLERTEADPGAYYLFEEEMRNRNLIAKMDSMEKNIIQRMES